LDKNIIMPTSTKIREYIHKQIDQLDDHLLNAVYAMLKSYQESKAEEFKLTEKQEKELDHRIKRHKEGKSGSFTWEEVKQRTISGQ
jgi:putative addiction module component (TIGR02574 family)